MRSNRLPCVSRAARMLAVAARATCAFGALVAVVSVGGTARANDPNTISDPLYPYQWPLNNVGQTFPPNCGIDPNVASCRTGTPDADIDWAEAWAEGVTGSGVVIALGSPCAAEGQGCPLTATVACDHPDLVGRLWVNPGESGAGKETNGVDDDGNGFIDDVNGANFGSGNGDVCLSYDPNHPVNHDTDVARLAMANIDGQGAVGVAPGAKLMLLVGWDDADDDVFFEETLPYAEAEGARVIFVPYVGFGGPITTASSCRNVADPFGPGPKRDDILAASNVLVVWGFVDEYPGCDPSSVGVMVTSYNDSAFTSPPNMFGVPPSSFMNFAAPGDRAWIRSLALSWAIPIVAGVSALALESKPSLSRADLVQRLEDGADNDGSGWNSTYGHGRLNAYETVRLLDFDADAIDGDGNGNGVAGDALCAPGQSAGCDDVCPFAFDATQANDDADVLGNACDNCPTIDNAGQEDVGGTLGAVPDGVGDPCQCGDATGNGIVDAADHTAAALCALGTGPCLPTCDADTSGTCDAADPPAIAAGLAGAGALGCILP